eukprot:320141-Chlamydomonas_euryale.AAC.1
MCIANKNKRFGTMLHVESVASLPHICHYPLHLPRRHSRASLVDKVCRAGDVIQRGRLPRPVMQLARVRDKPDVHAVHLRKALDLGQHVADVLRLGHEGRPLVVELIVGVDDEAADAVPGAGVRNGGSGEGL